MAKLAASEAATANAHAAIQARLEKITEQSAPPGDVLHLFAVGVGRACSNALLLLYSVSVCIRASLCFLIPYAHLSSLPIQPTLTLTLTLRPPQRLPVQPADDTKDTRHA